MRRICLKKNKTAESTPTVPNVEASGVQESPAPDTVTGETPCTPVCKPREDSSSLTDLLCEAKNVVYEARGDSTGISFVKNGMGAYCCNQVAGK